jgi:hypothetical protein
MLLDPWMGVIVFNSQTPAAIIDFYHRSTELVTTKDLIMILVPEESG